MTAKEPYELLIDGLHARAVEDFEQTEEALLLGEKIVPDRPRLRHGTFARPEGLCRGVF